MASAADALAADALQTEANSKEEVGGDASALSFAHRSMSAATRIS